MFASIFCVQFRTGLCFTFLFIASKNIFSEGYIQFPFSLTPLSFSLFAGFAPSELSTGDALGIVEITRCVSSPFGAAGASAGGGEEKKREKSPGIGAGGDWSISSESQELPLLAALGPADAPGKEAVGLDFSHAARVFSSTGQTSAGASDSGVLAMLAYGYQVSSGMVVQRQSLVHDQ